jgi:hypothetical protein
MCLAVLLVHGDAGRRELAAFGAQAAADAFVLVDVHNAVLIHAHGFVLLGTLFVAGMILAVLADIDFVLELVELAKFDFDAAVAGTRHAVVYERTIEFAAGAADAMAVFIGILNDVVIFHE